MALNILTWGQQPPAPDPAADAAGRHSDTVVLDAVRPEPDRIDSPVPVIELHEVTKVYATGSLEVHALQGVSLRIERGEYVAIMGPSGSGKSTLMHIIGCLDVPTAGQYRLAGEDVGEMDEVELAEVRNRQIGFVFQQFNLLPSLNAWRNVELPMTYAGVKRDERKQRAIEALDRVGLADRVGHRPGELSGGQQQRVAVARALVSDPAMILADEPTGNLDSVATEDALALFDELHAQGRTIVLITHEIEVAQRARRIVRVRDGRLQSAGHLVDQVDVDQVDVDRGGGEK
jgi:putative ABC transport system ATP-binding protein